MAQVAQVNQQVSLYKSISKELKAALAQVDTSSSAAADVKALIKQANTQFSTLEKQIPQVKENQSYQAIKASYNELSATLQEGAKQADSYAKQAKEARKQLEAADAFIAKASEQQKS